MPLRRIHPLFLVAVAACSSSGAPTPPPPPPPPPAVATVTVTPAAGSVVAGSTIPLIATARDAGGQTMSGQTISWQSENGAVATVSSSGVVTGVTAGGPVTITASTGGRSGTAEITVTAVPVASVTVTAPRTTVPQGTTLQLALELKSAAGAVLTGRQVTWSSSAAGVATVSAAGLVNAVTQGPVTITATSEGKSGNVQLTVTRPPLAQGWSLSRPITVTAGTAAVPADYSVSVVFDHAALVAAGKSLASGNDVRIGRWNGTTWTELDRVLDPGSTWNATTTRVWFRAGAPIAAQGQEEAYHLHYGNPAAGNPPANADNVFLFHDDFESGTLGKWSQNVASWTNVDTRAHRGTRAMRHGPEGPQGRTILASPALDVDNVIVEAWWNVTSLHPEFNASQIPRYRPGQFIYYTLFCLCIGNQVGFNIASYLGDTYTDLAVPSGNPQPNTWMRVGTAMHDGWYRVLFNGQVALALNNLNAFPSGNIGFSKFVIPAGNELWIDDVLVRRHVFPEPTSTLGGES
jgi:hypothetical protein